MDVVLTTEIDESRKPYVLQCIDEIREWLEDSSLFEELIDRLFDAVDASDLRRVSFLVDDIENCEYDVRFWRTVKSMGDRDPFQRACIIGDLEIVTEMLTLYKPYCYQKGYDAFHFACTSNHIDVARALLEAGFKVNELDQSDGTALHNVAGVSQESELCEMASFLIEQGADLELVDDEDLNVLGNAIANGSYQMVEHLLDNDACPYVNDRTQVCALTVAVYCGNDDAVEAILSRFPDMAVENSSGVHLDNSILHGYVDVVRALLEGGVSSDAAIEPGQVGLRHYADGRTALFSAVFCNLDIMQLLLDHKANVNARDEEGCSPMKLAVSSNYRDEVMLLLRNGAYAHDGGVRYLF